MNTWITRLFGPRTTSPRTATRFRPTVEGLEGRDCPTTFSVGVLSTANIYGAGHAVNPAPSGGGAGTSPTLITLNGAAGGVITISSTTGAIAPGGQFAFNGPDGGSAPGEAANITSFGGISGIIHSSHGMFLTGVFLTDAEPSGSGPAVLSFSNPENFTTLSPLIGQTFFIGDGLTDTGMVQQFHIPAGATRLYLGFPDGFTPGSPTTPPGWYDDNLGSLTVEGTISGPVDLSVQSLAWDAAAGGLSLSYQISGGNLPANTPAQVQLYWATGSGVNNRIGGPINVPQLGGETAASTYTMNVAGSLLANAPVGATHLQLVVDGSGAVSEPNEGNNVLTIPDVLVTRDAAAKGTVSAYSLAIIREALREAGQQSAAISATQKSPRDQAKLMFNACLNRGVRSQLATYSSAGDAVVRVYQQLTRGLSRSQILAKRVQFENAMRAKISAVGPQNVSAWCSNPNSLQIFNIRATSLGGTDTQQRFADALTADTRVDVFTGPPDTVDYHLEITQPIAVS